MRHRGVGTAISARPVGTKYTCSGGEITPLYVFDLSVNLNAATEHSNGHASTHARHTP